MSACDWLISWASTNKDLSDKLIFVNLHKQISSLSISGILSQVHTSSSNAEVLRASIFKASGKWNTHHSPTPEHPLTEHFFILSKTSERSWRAFLGNCKTFLVALNRSVQFSCCYWSIFTSSLAIWNMARQKMSQNTW